MSASLSCCCCLYDVGGNGQCHWGSIMEIAQQPVCCRSQLWTIKAFAAIWLSLPTNSKVLILLPVLVFIIAHQFQVLNFVAKTHYFADFSSFLTDQFWAKKNKVVEQKFLIRPCCFSMNVGRIACTANCRSHSWGAEYNWHSTGQWLPSA